MSQSRCENRGSEHLSVVEEEPPARRAELSSLTRTSRFIEKLSC